eukprot:990148-Pleurochrysis_carterae.AAC.2
MCEHARELVLRMAREALDPAAGPSRQLKTEMLVPASVVGFIIGKKGENINRMKKESAQSVAVSELRRMRRARTPREGRVGTFGARSTAGNGRARRLVTRLLAVQRSQTSHHTASATALQNGPDVHRVRILAPFAA